MNTFVQRSRFGDNRYRVATYVKARNQRSSQIKILTGFMSYQDACEQAQKLRNSTYYGY